MIDMMDAVKLAVIAYFFALLVHTTMKIDVILGSVALFSGVIIMLYFFLLLMEK